VFNRTLSEIGDKSRRSSWKTFLSFFQFHLQAGTAWEGDGIRALGEWPCVTLYAQTELSDVGVPFKLDSGQRMV